MINQSFDSTHTLFPRKRLPRIVVQTIGLIVLAGCNSMHRGYPIDEQYGLARSRTESMKEQLGFGFELEKEVVRVGEAIMFMVHFSNRTGDLLTLRLPDQSDVSDLRHANTRIQYSIIPLDKSISLMTPFSYLGMPFILSNPAQPNEFVILEPSETKTVELELPNSVYLKQGETWVESVIPAGQYLVHITYKNWYIGYQIERDGQIYVLDKSAWVGEMETKPILLTILP